MSHQDSLAWRRERCMAIQALVISFMAGVLVGMLAWAIKQDTGVAVMVGLAFMVLVLKIYRWGQHE